MIKRLLLVCIIGLMLGNTATIIALTTNLAPGTVNLMLAGGLGLTILSVIGIVLVGYYTKKRK
ncbi:hypothetical protein ACFQO8_00245 [Exiguobacterium aestuarii]|uniref:LPXTG cell wall anchor domain-containing protein n=1 Tax=Exiguobacterium aestuarii TaxID=273527 RepID=A0ABW2PMZ7_9BACL|nr:MULTISPECIES: hypothetical protein [Exiguobacterium]MCT4787242.1 hypothetical protein [Exiguobacterium aestuarii]